MPRFWKTTFIAWSATATLFAILVAGSAVVLAQNRDVAGAASVAGRLVDATTLKPLKGGKVFLSGVTTTFITSASTDEQGAFRFTDLAPGIYSIDASAPGYESESLPIHLVVRGGQQVRVIDLLLARPGSVSGSVHDPSGLPLAHVVVQLVTKEDHPRAPSTVTTGDNGEFHMSKLSPGSYYVRAIPNSARTDSDGMPTDTIPVYFPQARRVEDAQTIEIVPDHETAAIDLTLKPLPAFSITGKVIDGTTGKPVSQGGLNATHNSRLNPLGAHSKIAADGSFRLEGLPAGHYRVNFIVSLAWLPSTRVFPSAEFDLAERDMNGVVFTIKPGAALRGHLLAGRPLPQNFYLLLTNHGHASAPEAVYIQADGSFDCPNVYPGDYDLTVPGPGWYIREMRLGDKLVDTRTEGIVVKDEAPLPELNIVLDSQATTLSGTVVNESGAPQPGVTVILMSQATKRSPDGWLRTRTTSLDGRYHIEDVIPGEYWMLAWPRRTVLELRDPHIFAQIESETVALQVAASPLVQDLKLTSKTRAVADGVKPSYIFPAAKY